MNRTFKNQNIYAVNDPASYYGELTLFDFEGHQTMKSMSDKIIRDWNFDKQCRKNEENRKRIAEKQN
ncbi:MAG: hypothetical protein K2J67_11260 [Lachnospiraceae bacterium]|nr:hypothetical protein [Lachnospiraceae bacterium]